MMKVRIYSPNVIRDIEGMQLKGTRMLLERRSRQMLGRWMGAKQQKPTAYSFYNIFGKGKQDTGAINTEGCTYGIRDELDKCNPKRFRNTEKFSFCGICCSTLLMTLAEQCKALMTFQ